MTSKQGALSKCFLWKSIYYVRRNTSRLFQRHTYIHTYNRYRSFFWQISKVLEDSGEFLGSLINEYFSHTQQWATQKGHIIFALWRHDHRSPKKMRSKIQSHTSIRSLDWVWPEWWWGRVLCIDQIFVFTTLAIFTNDKEWKIGHKMVEIMCHYHRFQSDIEPDLLVSESSQMLNLTNIKRIWDETNPRSRGSGSLTKILRGK